MRIAILGGTPEPFRPIGLVLAEMGFECHTFPDGDGLLAALKESPFNLLIIDWTLAYTGGTSLMKAIRQDLDTPLRILLMISGPDEIELVEDPRISIDDFLIRSESDSELKARIGRLFRGPAPSWHDGRLVFGPYHFFPALRALEVHGEPVVLRNREYRLALLLFQNLGRLLSREYLFESVWRTGAAVGSRTLDTHLSRVRTKLDLTPANGYLLLAVHRIGYRMEVFQVDAAPRNHDYASLVH